MPQLIISGISQAFAWVSQSLGQVAYVLLTRSPLEVPKYPSIDLHVLGTPPAFILSQDQTLKIYFYFCLFLMFPGRLLSGFFYLNFIDVVFC